MVLKLSLYSSKSLWWYSDYPFSSRPGGTWAIPILITVSLVVLSLSLITSLSVLWYSEYPYTESHHSLHISSDNPYIHHSLPGASDNPYKHHSRFGGPQSIPINIKFCLVVLRLSLYSLQSPWWYLEYPYAHHSLPGGTQTIHILITVSLRLLRLSLYSSQSPWW